MLTTVIQVAIGGAIGSALRFLTGVAVMRVAGPGMPLGVMTANVIGGFLMGVFVVAAAHRGLNHLAPFVMTGLLGGFTTFSAFSLESVTLLERGHVGTAMLYILLSVGGSLGALWLGVLAARGIFA